MTKRVFEMPHGLATPHGTIFRTDDKQERDHGLYQARRILAIRDDREMTDELRSETLRHLLEEQTRIGMLQALRRFAPSSDHYLGIDRAPAPFEKGSRKKGVKGVDLILSYNEKTRTNKPRRPVWAFDVKSYERRPCPHDFQYNPVIGTPALLHLCGGNWIISPDGESLYDLIKVSSRSNGLAQKCIEFIECNLVQFGSYMLHELSSAMNMYTYIANRYGHLRICCPEWNNVFPQDAGRFDQVLADTYLIFGTFASNGIHPIWRIDGSPNKHTDRYQFLPTTPLQ